jgi:signal transduction histidine kinase
LDEPLFLTIPRRDGLVHRARLLARPADDGQLVVVGTSLEDRDDTIALLNGLMLVGGPIILLLISGLGYILASAALRPVGAMRERAAEISGSPDGVRLPLPEAQDDIYRLGDTLNAMLERIDAVLERERAFVADASHELRTPLGILKAEIELALSGQRSHEELRLALVSASEETDHLVRLAEDLLVLGRAEQGGIPIKAEDLSLQAEVQAAVDPFLRQAQEEGRTIEVDVKPDARAQADPVRLRQAVGNLIDNALRHGAGTVTVRARSGAEAAEISVSDEGGGFPDGFSSDAFKRFSRADAGRSGRGAGLGLSIVAAIAQAHGGAARIEDAERARVTLTLPRGDQAAFVT